MQRRIAIVLLIGAFIALAIAIPDAKHSTYVSDQDHIRAAAASLDAYCDQKPDECKGN